MDISNIESVIYICGMQVACKGNRAEGEMMVEFEDGPVAIPCCKSCADALYPVDSNNED